MKKILCLIVIILSYASLAEAVKVNLNDGTIIQEKINHFQKGGELFHAKKFTEAMIEWKKGVEKGDGACATMVGVLYDNGYEGITKNKNKALEWYLEALDLGFYPVKVHLAVLYLNGESPIKQDLKKAYEYIHDVEDSDYELAPEIAYKFYLYAWGTTQNFQRATELASKIQEKQEKEKALNEIENVKQNTIMQHNSIANVQEENEENEEDEEDDDTHKQRRWFLDNFEPNMKWNIKNMTKRFGAYEKYNPEVGNPKILQMFYFEEVDITLMVNISEGTIVTWRFGRAYK